MYDIIPYVQTDELNMNQRKHFQNVLNIQCIQLIMCWYTNPLHLTIQTNNVYIPISVNISNVNVVMLVVISDN